MCYNLGWERLLQGVEVGVDEGRGAKWVNVSQ